MKKKSQYGTSQLKYLLVQSENDVVKSLPGAYSCMASPGRVVNRW